MPAFENIRFVATEFVTGMVILGMHLVEVGGRRTTVVCGEDQQRVVGQAVFVESLHDLPDGVVDLHDKVTVEIDASQSYDVDNQIVFYMSE